MKQKEYHLPKMVILLTPEINSFDVLGLFLGFGESYKNIPNQMVIE